MDITDLHWSCFRYITHEKKPTSWVAEKLDITPVRIRELLAELKRIEPELFPCESEYNRFGQQNKPRDGYSLSSINELSDDDVATIKTKF